MTLDASHLLGLPARVTRHRYTRRDTILYALGVGAGRPPDGGELRFVYEEGLEALPTMAVVLGYPGFWQQEPEYGIDWRRVLHAEQSCLFHRPLPVEGDVVSAMKIDAIVDKGASKGCLMRASREIRDAATDALLATVRQVSFLRGDGGCGSGGEALPVAKELPTRAPDARFSEAIRPEQALIYRLSGDYNPLHADPVAAVAASFSHPILHGLCTYGIAGRILVNWACAHDASALTGLHCRFTAPVFPGEVLDVELWREAEDLIAFRVHATERDMIVIDRGWATLQKSEHPL